jgi:AAA+ superfamily predicted ATPase
MSGREPDPLAGIRILDEQAELLLASLELGAIGPALEDGDALVAEGRARLHASIAEGGRLAEIRRHAALGDADVEVLALLLAIELDLRRQRLVAYLQDDVTRTRPTLQFLGSLLGSEALLSVAPDAPLRRAALVTVGDGGAWSSHSVTVPDPVSWAMVGDASADPHLPTSARVEPAAASTAEAAGVVLVSGADLTRRREAALAACPHPLALVCSLPADVVEWDSVVRHATLQGTGVVLDVGDRLDTDARHRIDRARHLWWCLSSVHELPISELPAATRAELPTRPAAVDPAEVEALVGPLPSGHRLTADQVELIRRIRPVVGGDATAAIRRLGAGPLEQLTRRIRPRRTRADLVLTHDQEDAFEELVLRYRMRQVVYGDWGIPPVPSAGVVALLSGPSGTGKTTAAEIVAGELGLDLFMIDISTVVSKYIGETEQNLERIFDAAAAGNHVLLFDEADALFGARTAVSDARDRYANIEVSYLLQRLETFDGLLLMTTNLQGNIDQAFMRRVHVAMDFPVPDAPERKRIWQRWLAEGAPLGDIDVDSLAERAEVPGGVIRNACLSAAFLAAAGHSGGLVTTDLVVRSLRRELQKLGRLTDGFAHDLP